MSGRPPERVFQRDHIIVRDGLRDRLGAKTYIEATRRSETLKQGDLPIEHIWTLIAGSFDHAWMKSFAKKSRSPGAKPPSTEAYNRLLKRLEEMAGGIENVEFFHMDYRSWLPHDAVIYCDPPYVDTEKYRDGDFDTKEFWALMDIWRQDNTVLVSEQAGECPLSGVEVLYAYPAGKRKERTDALYFL